MPDQLLQIDFVAAALEVDLASGAIDPTGRADLVFAPNVVTTLQRSPSGSPCRHDAANLTQVHAEAVERHCRLRDT